MSAATATGALGGTPKIRVMICDDSSVMRGLITRCLEAEPAIQVVASTANGAIAVDTARRIPIDVVLLDVEMPVMDGLTALPLLLAARPEMRVIVASALTTAGAAVAMRAIEDGAAECLHKPTSGSRQAFEADLRQKVMALGKRRASASPQAPTAPSQKLPTSGFAMRPAAARLPQIIAVGSSTGGPQALLSLFGRLTRRLTQPIVVTQHMPPLFTKSLAEHINRLGVRSCVEVEDGMPLLADRIHVAPGNRHLLVEGEVGRLVARLADDPPENSCRPAVDPMLRSAAVACHGRVLAVILTGMGRDGAQGARHVVDAGGSVLAQDEVTSVVWGMPGAVAKEGLCHAILPLDRMANKIVEMAGCQ